MAEASLLKVEEQLNCSICLEMYTEPKLLQCHHIYCKKCLVKLVDRDQQGQLSLSCPECRQATPVPANGVAGLQSAFQVNKFLDIINEHKESIENVLEQRTHTCANHQGSEVELFCETCEKLICLKCTINDHNGHRYNLLGEVFEKQKTEILATLNPARKQLAHVKDALGQVDLRYQEIFDQQTFLEAQIHKDFQLIYRDIQARENKLLSELRSTTDKKLRELASQRRQLETVIAELSSCLEFMENIVTTKHQREVLEMKTTLIQETKELITSFQLNGLEPTTEADMNFFCSTDIGQIFQTYGQVYTLSSPDPSKCHIMGKGTREAATGEVSTAILHTKDFQNKPHQGFVRSIESELVSKMTGVKVQAITERIGQNQYKISYQPTSKGRHHFYVKVKGQHIRGSPFTVTVRSPVEKIAIPLLTIDEVMAPCGIAIKQGGEVVVTEHDAHCVSVFSPSGKKIQSFGRFGLGQGEFKNPRGVTVDNEGNILVVDNKFRSFRRKVNF